MHYFINTSIGFLHCCDISQFHANIAIMYRKASESIFLPTEIKGNGLFIEIYFTQGLLCY